MDSVQNLDGIRVTGGVRVAGLLCIAGGIGWVASGTVLSAAGPLDGTAFVVSEIGWILVQSMLLVGVAGLILSGAAAGWFGAISLAIAVLGRVDFVVAEIHSLLIGEESFLLPVGAMISAVGMTLVGLAVIRARRWSGWRRYAPLLVGLYPFVAMFPFIFISNEPNMLAIAGWGVVWALLGLAIYKTSDSDR